MVKMEINQMVKITLTGPQGSGKTRLAREIRKAARRLGLRIRIKEQLPKR